MIQSVARNILVVVCALQVGLAAAQKEVEQTPPVGANPAKAGGDLDPAGACKAEIARLCTDVEVGQGRLWLCLHTAVEQAIKTKSAPPISESCHVQVLIEMAKAANATTVKTLLDLVGGLKEMCKEDIQEHCSEGQKEKKVPVLTCLVHRKPKLQPACREKVGAWQAKRGTRVRLDPLLKQGCQMDLQKFCTGIKGPKGMACLRRHRAKLSPTCAKKLFRRDEEDSEDIRYNTDVFQSCKGEIESQCATKELGEARVLNCLWRKSLHMTGEFGSTCREKVQNLTRHSVSSYRLDFRVRTRCAGPIEQLCAQEKETVDKLALSELLSEGVQEQKAGSVLTCLKKNLATLNNEGCQEEMKRVVRVHAWDAKADQTLLRTCREDIKINCQGSNQRHPKKLHSCLREHIGELSEKCQEEELLQGQLESGDLTLKPKLFNTCRYAMAHFCFGIEPGEARLRHCLAEHMWESQFPQDCKVSLQEDLRTTNHDWRLKFGISQNCLRDLDTLCSAEKQRGGGEALACLREHYVSIKAPRCKTEMGRFIRQGQRDISLAPSVQNSCMEDVKNFCHKVEPGSGRVHDCLVQHQSELSPACAKKEFHDEELKSHDIRLDPHGQAACASSITELCKGVPESGVWSCLEDHKDSIGMTAGCGKVVKHRMQLKHSEFHLNPTLKKCKADAEELCPQDMSLANGKDFSARGSAITCLMKKRGQIKSSDCKRALLRKERQRVEDNSLDPKAKDECVSDVSRYCQKEKSFGAMAVKKCLQEDPSRLTEACRKQQGQYATLGARDIRLNPALQADCAAMQKQFCPGVQPGDHRLLECLSSHLHDTHMLAECRRHLVKQRGTWLKFHNVHPWVKEDCKEDLAKLKDSKCAKGQRSQGAELKCLEDNKGALSRDCAASLTRHEKRISADGRERAGFNEACKEDRKRLCKDVEPGAGRLNACLRKRSEEVQNTTCKEMVLMARTTDRAHAAINIQTRKNCANEMQVFCKQVPPGESRMLACLGLHQQEEGFSQLCKATLKETTDVQKAVENHKEMFSMRGMDDWIRRRTKFLGVWTGLLAMVTVVLCSLGISYRLVRKKFLKDAYTVEVPRDVQS